MNKNEINTIINNLTHEEKDIVIKILDEYDKTGSSKLFNELKYQDYKEIPVDILTFVDDNYYLGYAWHDTEGNTKLYPYWRKELKKIFPNNTDTNFNNAIFSGSRGRGKSEISVLIACYLMYRLMCLKNPLEFYHMKPTEKICFAFMNIKLALAEDIGDSKFQNTISMSPYFKYHFTEVGRGNNKKLIPPDFIEIRIGSQASDVIGLPIYFAFFDEISFIRNKNIDQQKEIAINMIDTAIGGMKTRFIYKGKNPTLLILASSKRSDKSFLEEHMKKKLISEKDNVYISDGSVWEVKPKGTYSDKIFRVAVGNKFLFSKVLEVEDDVNEYKLKGYNQIIDVPIDFKPNFIDDIDRALCDYAGISSSEISKYIRGDAVNDIIVSTIQNPFEKDILEIGNGPNDDAQYYDYFDINKLDKNLMYQPLYIHLDMSVSGDMTGIAGVFIKGKRPSVDSLNQSRDLFYSLAFNVSIKAPKGSQISFDKNRNFIYWLKQQGLNIKGISTDTYQSYDTGQALKAKGFNYTQISVDRTNTDNLCVPYQNFKSIIYERRLEIYNSKVLIDEIVDLEKNTNTGKIDHPNGGKKDNADAVCGALYNASNNAEQFAYDYGEMMENLLVANSDKNIIKITQPENNNKISNINITILYDNNDSDNDIMFT